MNEDEMRNTTGNARFPTLNGPTLNPAHDLISSERYLESLEKKLGRVKGKQLKEATPKDIISSLEKVKESQMIQMLGQTDLTSGQHEDPDQYIGSIINKSHSSVQQNLEEVVALVHHDQLSKVCEDSEHQKSPSCS